MKKKFQIEWRWWKQHNIREQIFYSMLFLTILAVGILGTVSYYATSAAIERNYRLSYEVAMQNSSRVLDLKLKSIVEKVRDILSDRQLAKMLDGTREYDDNEFLLADQKILDSILDNITYQEQYVNSVAVMDFHGHYYFANNIRSGTYEYYNHYRTYDYQAEEWYIETERAGGREVYWGKGVLGGTEGGDEFCMTKLMNSPSTGKPMGCIVVTMSKNMLGTSLVKTDEGYDTSSYMIVDEKHGLLPAYTTGEKEAQEKILEAYSGGDERRYMFSTARNTTTDWRFVNVIEKNELSTTSRYLRNVVFLLGGVLVLLGFILARMLSETITKPLKQLEQTIYDVGEGERHVSAVFDDSEVGRIGNKFKEMVNTNLELSEHLMATKLNEREAELLLLQSQINPHFLYNTLDSIYCVAMIHGDDQIGEMILALSNNFKLALNRGEKYISVENSVRGVEEYMKLQNMRYNNRFDLQIQVDPEMMPQRIITFILQPFVENSVYHGLEPKIGKGKVRLSGVRKEGSLVFQIIDDGVGIADLSKLESGYGIRNVKERIQLNYGPQYGVEFASTPGEGTTVTITIPEGTEAQEYVPTSSN